jgi:hypothetical protein
LLEENKYSTHKHTPPCPIKAYVKAACQLEEYAANVIADSIYAQVDDEGYEHLIFDEIIDYQKNAAVAVSDDDRYIISANGNQHQRQTKGIMRLVKG